MSTRRLQDKEFDRYARNILKNPEGITFDAGAWAAMEQRLNAVKASSSAIEGKWISPLIIAALMIVGYTSYETLSAAAQYSIYPQSLQGNEEMVVLPSDTEKESEPQASTKQNATQYGSIGQSPALAGQPQLNTSNTATLSEQETISAVGTTHSSNDPQLIANTNVENEAADVPTDRADFERTVARQASLSSQLADGSAFKATSLLAVSSMGTESREAVIGAGGPLLSPVAISEPEEISEKVLPPMPYSRWAVGLIVAPDFTTVRQLQEFTNPGFDYGLSVEYIINRKFSINSGAILTRKIYNTSDASEYTVPSGYWNNGVRPEEILANCQVIDIPINIRYLLVEGKRTHFFASAGISSYLMLNERYDYKYDEGTPGWYQKGSREVSNENNHFFGVYNLSVAVSHRIGQQVFIEVEPFLKNSLGGVGWGQVRLKSTGALFKLKYHFRKN